MNLKISLLSIVLMAMPFFLDAQTARNPLNLEPARVTLQKRLSAWKLSNEVFYLSDGSRIDKRTVTYDENGRKKVDMIRSWNKNDDTWRNTLQSDYRYEAEKEVVITRSGGLYQTKTETFFSTTGKPVYSLTYRWNNETDDWAIKPHLRCAWEYDSYGIVMICLKQSWNSDANKWSDYNIRILYSYNEAGALIEELFQTCNGESEQWINKGKYSYLTDNEQQKTAISFFFASGQWIFDGKTVYFYDNEGKIARCEYYNSSTGELFSAYSLITYSESIDFPVVVESQEVTVYPNPVVSTFELTVPDEYLGKTMQLFDMTGVQVKMMAVQNQKTQVDISGLSSGVYILRIGDITKKLIVK
jgi:hypothetical protein